MMRNTSPIPTRMGVPEIDLGFELMILGSKCDIQENSFSLLWLVDVSWRTTEISCRGMIHKSSLQLLYVLAGNGSKNKAAEGLQLSNNSEENVLSEKSTEQFFQGQGITTRFSTELLC